MVPFPTVHENDAEAYTAQDLRRRDLQREILNHLTTDPTSLETLIKALPNSPRRADVVEALLDLIDTGYVRLDSKYKLRAA